MTRTIWLATSLRMMPSLASFAVAQEARVELSGFVGYMLASTLSAMRSGRAGSNVTIVAVWMPQRHRRRVSPGVLGYTGSVLAAGGEPLAVVTRSSFLTPIVSGTARMTPLAPNTQLQNIKDRNISSDDASSSLPMNLSFRT